MPLSRIARDIRDLKRFNQILLVLFKYEFGHFLKRTQLKKELPVTKKIAKRKFGRKEESKPQRLRQVFEDLGATFIKLGQLLSLRPDLIPKEYCDEFAKLQDKVTPFPAREAKTIIERELKKPIEELFSSFEPEPIAAASIGQVHRAVLKTGEKVVVKVQRPGIRELVETDIDIMYYMAHLIEKHYNDLLFDPGEIVKEFESYTTKEMNYIIEAKNIEKFYKNFLNSRIIKVPTVFWSYTTDKVLTIEYIEGQKIDKVKKSKKYNSQKIIENLVNSIFKQIFIDGFFHADPHPGNVLILDKSRIALLDFGIVGSFDPELKERITNLFIHMIIGDVDGVANSLVDLGFVDYTIDMDILKGDLRESLRQYYDTPVKYVNMSVLFPKLIDVAKRHKIKLPANFVLLGKSLATTEGFCSELDPDFNLVKTARPFVKKLVSMKKHPKHVMARFARTSLNFKEFITELPRQSRQILRMASGTSVSFKEIDKDLKSLGVEIDRSSGRIALGVIISALVLGAALVIRTEQPDILGMPFFSFIGVLVALFLILVFLSSFVYYKRKV